MPTEMGRIRYLHSGEEIPYFEGQEDKMIADFADAMYCMSPSGVRATVTEGDSHLRYRLYCARANEYGIGPGDEDFMTEEQFERKCLC